MEADYIMYHYRTTGDHLLEVGDIVFLGKWIVMHETNPKRREEG